MISRELLTVLAGSALAALLYLYLFYRRRFRHWTERGISGPKPSPLIGNLYTEATQARLDLEVRWRETYGKVYGIFRGSKPNLIIADAQLLRQIAIRDFDAFPDHEQYDFLNRYQKNSLFFLQRDFWKRVRTLMSPTFTSGKIKGMFRLLNSCANDMMDSVREQLSSAQSDVELVNGQPSGLIDLKESYHLFTMDTISTCCFGLKLERAGATGLKEAAARDQFIGSALKLFNLRLFCLLLNRLFPKRMLEWLRLEVSPQRWIDPFAHRVAGIVDRRRKLDTKYADYLQLLIDARTDDEIDVSEMDLEENHHAGLTRESILEDQTRMQRELATSESKSVAPAHPQTATGDQLKLTDLELLSNAIFLLFVGLETTGTLLTNCSYSLAFHPDIQERLYEEVGKVAKLGADGMTHEFEYEDLTKCQYLDCVISETLRRLTPLPQMSRQSVRDYYVEKYNLHLPKGSLINLALHSVHNDPDYWHQPERFNPDRFLPENRSKIVPGSYCPFGLGPRHCIGMRFSLTEAKLALAKMLMQFQFSPAPNTSYPPQSQPTFVVNNMRNPLVRVTQRGSNLARCC